MKQPTGTTSCSNCGRLSTMSCDEEDDADAAVDDQFDEPQRLHQPEGGGERAADDEGQAEALLKDIVGQPVHGAASIAAGIVRASGEMPPGAMPGIAASAPQIASMASDRVDIVTNSVRRTIFTTSSLILDQRAIGALRDLLQRVRFAGTEA